MLFNPERVGGLPVGEGPSGPRPNAPRPVGTVENTDGGPIDSLVLLAVNDIQDFWQRNYAKYLPGDLKLVDTLVSYDSTDPYGSSACGNDMYGIANAMFCSLINVMAWDRGVFMPVAQQYFGDMGVVGVIAHEYGHALQWMAGIVDMDTDSLVFRPVNAPTLSTERGECTGARISEPTAYCPATNTIYVDLSALEAAGAAKTEEEDEVLVQGDNTALSMVTSRYALAVEHERGVQLDTPVAALRTACLTGVAQGQMTDQDGATFVLSPGDTDEAVAGLLTNGLVASDVNGRPAPAGFTRILAYRLGLSSAIEECFQRFGIRLSL
jgi:hypothetical protein